MKRFFPGLVLITAGFCAGIAFVVACGQGDSNSAGYSPIPIGPMPAAAQTACNQFETTIIDSGETYGEPTRLPVGWTPFGISTGNNVVVFRCAN